MTNSIEKKIKHYLFLNPVVWVKNEKETLHKLLQSLGYIVVFPVHQHIEDIKAEYRSYDQKIKDKIVDIRCPKAKQLALDLSKEPLYVPSVHPILIRSSLELYNTYVIDENCYLDIVTPCASLKNYGNKLGLKHLQYLTWREFQEKHQLQLNQKVLQNSPIPPDFFDVDNKAVLNNEEEIRRFFAKKRKEHVVEMLFCDHGCHNGDGI